MNDFGGIGGHGRTGFAPLRLDHTEDFREFGERLLLGRIKT